MVYVDDIIITGDNESVTQSLISLLPKEFALKYLGLLNYVLGIKVSTLPNEDVMFNQSKCIKELLLKEKIESSKPFFAPMSFESFFQLIYGVYFTMLPYIEVL